MMLHNAATWTTQLLTWFSAPSIGLPAIFSVAFTSATVLPMAAEPILFAFIKLNPHQIWNAILVATVGNTLGGMTTYFFGYTAKRLAAPFTENTNLSMRPHWTQRLGAPMLLLSWVPLMGDALCAMAGWLKLPWQAVLLWMSVGKFIRFVAMTLMLLWIPDSFWHQLRTLILPWQ